MQINFIERKSKDKEVSIEKLFSVIRNQLNMMDIDFTVNKNPYDLSILGFFKALFFFNKRQSEINHITGDIHWVSMGLKSKNTILTIHDIGGMYELKGIKRYIFYMWWLYLPIKRVKFVTVISKKTKDDILAFMPWAAEKIRVIYNCHTIKDSFVGEKKMKAIPDILIVGTRSNKNIERTIKALKGIPCKLYIVGELSELHLELLSNCQIDFENHLILADKELVALYQKAHIVTFISTFEGFGLPILEAQSQNCIVITSNLEPMLDVAGNGALFVDPFDINDINRGINEVIVNFDLQKKLIEEGKKNLARFDVKIIANQYIKLYEDILRNN